MSDRLLALPSAPRRALRRCAPVVVSAAAWALLTAGCAGDGPGADGPPRIHVDATSAVSWDAGAGPPSVQAYVDGAAVGRLLLDTAAERSLLSPRVVERQALHVRREGDDGVLAASCTLRFAEVDVQAWHPVIAAVPSEDVVGVVGQDVLARLELVLDPLVHELRVLPAGGVAHELAGFAAEGWRVETLPLLPGAEGLELVATPLPTAAAEAREPAHLGFDGPVVGTPQPARIALSTAAVHTVLPARFFRGGAGRPAGAGLFVEGRALQVEGAQPTTGEHGVLGADFLASFLVGWDGPGRTLYLAERPALARNF